MRAQEFVTSAEQLDEGWREQLANLAIAGTMAASGTGALVAKQALKSPNDSVQTSPTASQVVKKDTTSPAKTIAKVSAQATKASKKVEVKPITGHPNELLLKQEAMRAGIRDAELAAFMAQCAHESHDFRSLVEYGGSLDFRKYDPKYAPKKARALGNKYIGDGARYKGRGFIQITGRYNYQRAGQALGIDLVKRPELAADPKIAAKIAVWFWQQRVQPNVDNWHDVADVTKPINPRLNGLEDRRENFRNYMQVAMK